MSTYRCPKFEVSEYDPTFHRNGCPGSPEAVSLEGRIVELEERLADVEDRYEGIAKRIAGLEAAREHGWEE